MTYRGFRGHLAIALAPAVAGTAVAAGIAAWRASAPQGYWAAGMYRLLATLACERFDRWLPWTAAAAGLVALAATVAHGRPAGWRLRRAAVAVLVLVAGLRAVAALDAWRAGRGPNLLLVSIDTLRADHLGAYGYPLPTSPALDRRLAAEGVTFLDVYSQSPKTTPSHMTMLTSLYPCVHGVELWWGNNPAHVLNPAVTTLAEALRDAGFSTAAFTGGAHMDHSRGFDQGFEVYEDHGAETQMGHALRWLKHNHGRRFFLFFHTYMVHDPYLPPPELIAQFDGDYRGPILDTVRWLRTDASGYERRSQRFWQSVDAHDPRAVQFVERLYDAGIRHMDDVVVGGLLDALARYGLERDTLVVFTSDHGEAFAEHGRFLHDDLYGGTLRVPLILRFPGRLPAGRRVAARARLVDVMPTVLDLLGVRPVAGMQGRPLAPFLGDDAGGRDAPSEFNDPGRATRYESLRSGPFSYIADGPTERLFALDADPGETTDVLGSHQETVATLRGELARRRAECERLAAALGPRDDGVAPSAERLRQLRALGYVQ